MNPRSTTRSSKGSRGRGRRDRGALEQRRLRAARLFAKGMRPAEVARELEASRQSATQFLAEQQHWLEVQRPPAYAPELNPVEGLLANLKSRELANRCETHLQMVTIAARQGANRVRS